jgi:hypothetical protein
MGFPGILTTHIGTASFAPMRIAPSSNARAAMRYAPTPSWCSLRSHPPPLHVIVRLNDGSAIFGQ